MKNMDLVRSICEAELEYNSSRKTKIQKMIQKAPEGTLLVSSSNGTVQYYQKIEKKKLYLSKKKKSKQITECKKGISYSPRFIR